MSGKTDTRACKSCVFWQGTHRWSEAEGYFQGTCHIRAPEGGFPSRHPDDWCGEHVQRDEQPVDERMRAFRERFPEEPST